MSVTTNNIEQEQIQMFLEKWRMYIEDDDFDLFVEFITNTINGVKMDKMCVLFDKCEKINIQAMKDFNNLIETSYFPNNWNGTLLYSLINSKLCVFTSLEEMTKHNYDCLFKQILSDDCITVKKLYQPAEQIKLTCNVLGFTSKMPYIDNETINKRIKIIRCKQT